MKSINKYKSAANVIIKSYEDDLYYKEHFIGNVLSKHIVEQKTLNSLQIVVLPFIRFVTNSISTLYNQPVIRDIDTDKKDVLDLFREVENAYIKQANNIDKYTFLSGMVAVKSHYDDIDDNFEYVLFPNNMLEYTPREDDYTKVKELELSYLYDANKICEIWDDKSYTRSVADIKTNEIVNSYGFIPFTIFKNRNIPNSFFVPPSENLLDIQNYISNQITQTGNTFKYQSMNMLIIKGGKDIKQINYGANAVNRVDTEDSIDFIEPKTDLSQLIKVINDQIQMFSRINGIPDSLVSANATASGVSLEISQKVLDIYIKDRSKLFVDFERKCLMDGLRVLAYHRGIQLPKGLKIIINHSSANQMNKLTDAEMTLWDFYINKNIYTNVDLLMSLNPLMTRDEAIEKIGENIEENVKYNTRPYINSLNNEINNNNLSNFKKMDKMNQDKQNLNTSTQIDATSTVDTVDENSDVKNGEVDA